MSLVAFVGAELQPAQHSCRDYQLLPQRSMHDMPPALCLALTLTRNMTVELALALALALTRILRYTFRNETGTYLQYTIHTVLFRETHCQAATEVASSPVKNCCRIAICSFSSSPQNRQKCCASPLSFFVLVARNDGGDVGKTDALTDFLRASDCGARNSAILPVCVDLGFGFELPVTAVTYRSKLGRPKPPFRAILCRCRVTTSGSGSG